jgi:hypothetical protein
MTVAQQREQEVDALTKNELAQQRGDTAQKQVGDQQAAMQKMMSGIAGAPGAAMAAQPKAMAAGGIVGYAGPEGSQVQDPLEVARQRAQQALAKLRSYGLRQRQQDPEGYAAAEQENQQAQEAVAAAERAITGGPVGVMRRPMSAPAAPTPASVAEAAKQPPAAAPEAAVPPADKLPPANVVAAATQGAPKPPAPPAPPAAPKPSAPPGIAGLPGAAAAAAPPQVQLGAVGPANDFGKKLEDAALKNAEIDPAARQLAEETRITNKMALTPDQRKVYEEGIGGLQKMYNEQYDPERLQREGLKRALIGAGGRRYGEFGGAATAGMNYDDQMRAAKLKEFGDVQNARTGLIGIDRANVKEGIAGGQKAYEQSSMGQRQGLESGRGLYGEDVKSRDTRYNIDVGSRDNIWKMNEESRNKVLDRDIDRLKIAAQNAATAAAREGLSQDKNRNLYLMQLNRVEQLERNLDKDFAAGPMGLLLQQDPAKLKPEDRTRLEIAKLELEQKKAKIRKDMEPVLADVRRTLGITDAKMSKEEEDALQRNLNRGK